MRGRESRYCPGECRTIGDAVERLRGDYAQRMMDRHRAKAMNFGLAYGMRGNFKIIPATPSFEDSNVEWMRRAIAATKGRKS